MSALRDSSTVVRILSANPTVSLLTQVASQQNLPLFLTGGAVRDTFLGRDEVNDWDFFIHDDTTHQLAPIAQRYDELQRSGSYPGAHPISQVDISVTKDVVSNVQQFDLSIHCIIYDCAAKTLLDPEHGVRDLNTKLLRIPYLPFFVSGANSFIRPFRIAEELGFELPDAIHKVATKFAPMVGLADNRARAKVLSEFLRYFSVINIRRTLPLLFSTGLTEQILPILIPLRLASSVGSFTNRFEETVAVLDATHAVWESLPESAQNDFAVHQVDRRVTHGHKVETEYSWLGEVRFASLFLEAASSLLQLGGILPDNFKGGAFKAVVMKRAFSVLLQQVAINPGMTERIQECARILALAEHCHAYIQNGAFKKFENEFPSSNPVHRKAVFLNAARTFATAAPAKNPHGDELLRYLSDNKRG